MVKKRDGSNVSLYDFLKYFENINNPASTSVDETIIINVNMPENDEINMPISENEIQRAVKELKRNEFPGFEQILNEHIQITLDCTLPTSVKLFNILLDKAVIPKSWLAGEILPIFKNKGYIKKSRKFQAYNSPQLCGEIIYSDHKRKIKCFCWDAWRDDEQSNGFS